MSTGLSVLRAQLLNQVLERRQLPPVDQVELLHKEDEVLEGGVEVSLFLQLHHRVKMLVVDVCVDPEQTLQDGLGHRHEVLGEGHADLGREEGLVVQLVLYPGHQVVNVLGGGAFDGLLNVGAICPVVLVSRSR